MALLDPGAEADWWNWEALRKGCSLGAGPWEWLEEGEMMKGGETSSDSSNHRGDTAVPGGNAKWREGQIA